MISYPQFKSVPRPLNSESNQTLQKGIKESKYFLDGFKKSVLYSSS